MNPWFGKYVAIIVLLVAFQAGSADAVTTFSSAEGKKKSAAAFSFDSVWFSRDGTRVVPEISKRWLTVVFNPRFNAGNTDLESANDGFVLKKAEAIVNSYDLFSEYYYDPNIAEDACFFKMRNGLKLEDIRRLMNQLNRDRDVEYVHPTVVLNHKTFAFFNVFQMEWKTGADKARRKSLLGEAHTVLDENDEKGNRYIVDVSKIPFFRAFNLLAEDINVLRATPYLVEIRQSISAELSVPMNGGNIGDSIPFTLTIAFSDRVTIDPSSLAALNLRPSNLQKELFDCTFDPYDYAKAVTKSPIVITGRVRFYAPGEFTIPAITINYSCPTCSTSTVRALDTAPVLIRISSIIPAEQPGKRLIVPTDAIPLDFHLAALREESQLNRWLAICGFSGLFVCIVWLLLLFFRAIAERKPRKDEKKDRQLAQQLRALLQTTPTVPHWSYLGETGALLRRYLVARYGIDEKYHGGSGKQFMETIGAHIPEECVNPLRGILAAIDTSVSLESEQYQDMEQLQREILQVIDLTARKKRIARR